jgi:hypothetical protein
LFWLEREWSRAKQVCILKWFDYLLRIRALLPCVYLNRKWCKGRPKVAHHMSVSIRLYVYIWTEKDVRVHQKHNLLALHVLWLFSMCDTVLLFSFYFCFLVFPASSFSFWLPVWLYNMSCYLGHFPTCIWSIRLIITFPLAHYSRLAVGKDVLFGFSC